MESVHPRVNETRTGYDPHEKQLNSVVFLAETKACTENPDLRCTRPPHRLRPTLSRTLRTQNKRKLQFIHNGAPKTPRGNPTTLRQPDATQRTQIQRSPTNFRPRGTYCATNFITLRRNSCCSGQEPVWFKNAAKAAPAEHIRPENDGNTCEQELLRWKLGFDIVKTRGRISRPRSAVQEE